MGLSSDAPSKTNQPAPWAINVRHASSFDVLAGKLAVRDHTGALAVYRPRYPFTISVGPLTAYGRTLEARAVQ